MSNGGGNVGGEPYNVKDGILQGNESKRVLNSLHNVSIVTFEMKKM